MPDPDIFDLDGMAFAEALDVDVPSPPKPAIRRMPDGRPMQCKDIPDSAVIAAVRGSLKPWGSAMVWDVRAALAGEVGEVPARLFAAKMRSVVDRGLVGGCACGCRGDFHVSSECKMGCCRA